MKYLIAVLLIGLSGCGYSSQNSEAVGQVKRVFKLTPLICPDMTEVDLSLGVMRNGVGSMSNQDVEMYVPRWEDEALLKKAAETGQIVKITYNVKRLTFCTHSRVATSVEILK